MPILVVGIDIISEEPKRFAVVSWFNGKLVKHGEFTFYRLIRFIRTKKPDIVVTDNIHELGEYLRKFIHAIPQGTKIVQITGRPGEQKPLWGLAKEHGIRVGDKFNPYEEAKVCALLAARGIGYEVLAFEDEVIIKVSRGRSQGKGGWSQDRYRRRLHNLIQNKVREIEETLKKANIPFDIEIKEKDQGLERGEFRVYASREELAGLIKPMRGGDIEVRIRPVERKTFEFVPLKSERAIRERKSVIVGLDPGITVGIAALDLNGQVLMTYSERNMAISDVIKFISEIGHPIIISTDVNPAPGLVEKIARSFKALLFVPRESLKVEEKNELLRNLGVTVEDDHQRDALTAAYKAYLRLKPKLDHVDAKLRELEIEGKGEEIKALVIQGYNLGEAILKVKEKEKPKEEIRAAEEKEASLDLGPYLEKIKELEKTIEFLEKENQELRAMIEEQRKIIENLETKIATYDEKIREKILRTKEIETKEKRIAYLEKELREAKSIIEKLSKDLVLTKRMHLLELKGSAVPIKVIENLTWKELEELERSTSIKRDDVLYIINPAGAGRSIGEYISEKRVKAIISAKPLPNVIYEVLKENKIPVLYESEIEVKRVDEFAIVDRKELEKVIEEKLNQWKEEEKQKEVQEFLRLIEEYRLKRIKELKKKADEEH
ncbi:MAG TPA: DUF460 domain-containing protein [Thermococcaceae archaeon]|uniref:DUF460 domain-containing protein n=2 Tax=Thermococcus sibiricus TaxID=172049 RepID=C6A3M4_THESM|nr:DUF460 domain-containing protein [Thermococcus sibiricus]ACS90219.1 hypothetical protein TSIB_1165 [Thermococcus sibiricus MM 739]HII68081.1 DUF460 domain-containing protein [Thermococcaceae archaeon]